MATDGRLDLIPPEHSWRQSFLIEPDVDPCVLKFVDESENNGTILLHVGDEDSGRRHSSIL